MKYLVKKSHSFNLNIGRLGWKMHQKLLSSTWQDKFSNYDPCEGYREPVPLHCLLTPCVCNHTHACTPTWLRVCAIIHVFAHLILHVCHCTHRYTYTHKQITWLHICATVHVYAHLTLCVSSYTSMYTHIYT